MSSGASEGGQSGGEQYREPEQEVVIPEPSLLEKVLDETIDIGREATGQMESLLAVARRYPGQELTLEPVALDLISTILHEQFGRLPVSDQTWQQMSRSIAETLMDDPIARDRLLAFWQRMREATR